MGDKSPHTRHAAIYLPLLFALVLALGMLAGMLLRPQGTTHSDSRFFSIGSERYDKLNDIIYYINDAYVDSVDRHSLTEETIGLLLRNLDPHSAYIPASDFREMNDPLMGSFEGIGIEFNMHSDTVVVIHPIAGGPSERAGMHPGDRIITVEGDPISGVGMSSNEVVSLLKGPKGSAVHVGVARRGVEELLEFRLVRDKIPSFSLDVAFMASPDIGYIRLNKFSATTHREFVTAAQDLLEQGMEKMILDLRGNGGGLLDAAILLADELLEPEKLIVYTAGRKRPTAHAHARRNGVFETQPLVILIDEWSASASEVIAGAVQDNDRGLVVGRRSFGKGLVQEQVQLRDGSAIRLTVSRYYTPTGRSIQKPYDNGREDYYQAFLERFNHDEVRPPDEQLFNDSLRFETPAGRTVYGGGGIWPDVLVPVESGPHVAFFNQLANRGLIYRFAFDYTDELRDALARFGSAREFVDRFRVSPALYRQFLQFLEERGISTANGIPADSEALIKNHLKAHIGRHAFGADAFFPVLLQEDKAFSTAVILLQENAPGLYFQNIARRN